MPGERKKITVATEWRGGEIVRWVLDRRARRVPKFVVQYTHWDTKRDMLQAFGEGVVFALGGRSGRDPSQVHIFHPDHPDYRYSRDGRVWPLLLVQEPGVRGVKLSPMPTRANARRIVRMLPRLRWRRRRSLGLPEALEAEIWIGSPPRGAAREDAWTVTVLRIPTGMLKGAAKNRYAEPDQRNIVLTQSQVTRAYRIATAKLR